jgi:hypothetical protein
MVQNYLGIKIIILYDENSLFAKLNFMQQMVL